jgi:aspartyl-tRNA(Asn)/glutamyl-tRNA(Gln) amidotransferase subunit B
MSKLIRGYEVVIGLETHTQLSTLSKIFSGSSTAFGADANTQASPVDLALPGTLPVMNVGAVERAIQFGLAVGAKVATHSIFARKNYFYPDLPKGYQISQYETPVVQGGSISFLVGEVPFKVNLTRAHLEEDAGKSLHNDYAGQSGIDLNRAGTPLLEIVTEPDMRSSAEAVEYAKTLHELVKWIGICDGNMQEGSFRCDANVSVRKPGAEYGTRREIKNLNSFKFMQQAIDYEIQWQIDLIEDGGKVQQATVLFNADTGETRAMRSKEDAADYRYFPDPDLPPLVISNEWIARVKARMPELRKPMAERFQREFAISPYDADLLTSSRDTAEFFDAAMRELLLQVGSAGAVHGRTVANWINGEIATRMNRAGISNIRQSRITAWHVVCLVQRVADGTINLKTAKEDVLAAIWDKDITGANAVDDIIADREAVDRIIEVKGLRQMSDTGELERILDDVLAANVKSVEEFRAGKEKAFNALIGQAMKATKGKANPAQVNELLKKKLG